MLRLHIDFVVSYIKIYTKGDFQQSWKFLCNLRNYEKNAEKRALK